MIGDLCKPLNKGESNTIRIIGNVPEMCELDHQLDEVCGPLGPRTVYLNESSLDALRHILKRALEREDDEATKGQDRAEEKDKP